MSIFCEALAAFGDVCEPDYTLRELEVRDENRCQYRDPLSGRQCEARHDLQLEHVLPFAKGGSNEIENLQLLCATHNRLRAVQHFGVNRMQQFVPSLK